jgi:hypothetical protein
MLQRCRLLQNLWKLLRCTFGIRKVFSNLKTKKWQFSQRFFKIWLLFLWIFFCKIKQFYKKTDKKMFPTANNAVDLNRTTINWFGLLSYIQREIKNCQDLSCAPCNHGLHSYESQSYETWCLSSCMMYATHSTNIQFIKIFPMLLKKCYKVWWLGFIHILLIW